MERLLTMAVALLIDSIKSDTKTAKQRKIVAKVTKTILEFYGDEELVRAEVARYYNVELST